LWRYRKKSRGHGKTGKLQSIGLHRCSKATTAKSSAIGRPPDWAACCARNGRGAGDQARELKRILTAWEFEPANVMALVSARRGISTRVNRFIHILKMQFSPKPPWREFHATRPSSD